MPQARENMEINGGDDVDDDIPPEPRPTRRDVLKAASTINKYVEDSNDPLARKIAGRWRQFWSHSRINRQLRLDETKNMKGTVMTDFFRPK